MFTVTLGDQMQFRVQPDPHAGVCRVVLLEERVEPAGNDTGVDPTREVIILRVGDQGGVLELVGVSEYRYTDAVTALLFDARSPTAA